MGWLRQYETDTSGNIFRLQGVWNIHTFTWMN